MLAMRLCLVPILPVHPTPPAGAFRGPRTPGPARPAVVRHPGRSGLNQWLRLRASLDSPGKLEDLKKHSILRSFFCHLAVQWPFIKKNIPVLLAFEKIDLTWQRFELRTFVGSRDPKVLAAPAAAPAFLKSPEIQAQNAQKKVFKSWVVDMQKENTKKKY